MIKRWFRAYRLIREPNALPREEMTRECWATHHAIDMDTEIFEKFLREGYYSKVEFWDVTDGKPTPLKRL